MASRFDRDPRPAGPVVQGFVDRGFSVDGTVYKGLLLTPRDAAPWSPPTLADLTIEDVASLIDLDPLPEFLLLGSGAKFAFPAQAFRIALEERGIGLEVMDSRAAARSWGMLRGEERWIVAALMPMA